MTDQKTGARRVLLKLSGEALGDKDGRGLATDQLEFCAEQIVKAHSQGIEIGIVVGGGNFLRGNTIANHMISRVTGDQMGMMATVLNGLALRDAILAAGVRAKLFSAKLIEGVAEAFSVESSIDYIQSGAVAIFVAGTGNPFLTTDTAASLRGIEIHADVLLKATKVDGIYDKDPKKHADAKRLQRITYAQALKDELAVMDIAAFCQCRDYDLPIRVFDLFKSGALFKALLGQDEGSLVDNGVGS